MKPYILSVNLYITVILLVCSISGFARADDCPKQLRFLCHEQKNCGECMLAHSCCYWCYDQTNFNGSYRCDFSDALSACGQNIEKNKESSISADKNAQFTDVNSPQDANESIQIKPQSFNIILRKDTPVNLTFTYKASKNYPLELYYLADLSYSMKTHLETLKNLGNQLGRSLEQLTKHYKLAFGSFLDKPGMPFIWTDELNLNNPCRTEDTTCDKTYLFKHSLNFTNNTDNFFTQVRNSKISANVDDIDGALEAIMQILVCNKQFGWSEHSRKIIVLSTDSLLHTEGDGILAGATEVNIKDLCLVNTTGDHTDPLKYDYPSLGQIKRLLRKYKANLIVAVTEDKIQPYKRMELDILEQEAFVGVLETDSKNILQLVNKGFYDFIRQVEFSADHAPELDVKFYGDCYGIGDFNETSGCQNVREEDATQFKVQITLKEYTNKISKNITIKEKSINSDVKIYIEYVSGSCECPNLKVSQDLQCDHGKSDCGTCVCDLGWMGNSCSEECIDAPHDCREDEESLSCSGRGDCLCAKCSCPEPYSGRFCQFECPADAKGTVCSGRGTCFEGVCTCQKGYTENDCSCDEAVDECRFGSASVDCNERGICDCNKCKCQDGYTGRYCEIFESKNLFCNKYEDYAKNESVKGLTAEGETVILQEWEDDHLCASEKCSTVFYVSQAERCLIDYCYHTGENSSVLFLGITNKKCIYTAQAKGIGLAISAFFAVLLGGIILIVVKKCHMYREDKAEYKRFVESKNMANMVELNPLYVSPVTEFRNPMAR